jgi:hypothetical protein
MQKPTVIHIENRTFEIYAAPSCASGMAEVNIYEVVRPSWKIFRTRYFNSGSFWVEDYDTIFDGAYDLLVSYLDKERASNKVAEKWREFANRGRK